MHFNVTKHNFGVAQMERMCRFESSCVTNIKYKVFKSTPLSLQLVPAESALERPSNYHLKPKEAPVALTHDHNVHYVKLRLINNIHFLYSKLQLQMSKILLHHNFMVITRVASLFLCYLFVLGLPFGCLTPGALNIQS